MKKISVITPIYNEYENISDCCTSVKKFFEKEKKYEYEHILADNCSNDNSLELAKSLAKKDKNIKLIVNAKNYGIMPSLFNALKYTSGDAVLTCYACDMQDPIEYLDSFIKKWQEGYDVVYAIRETRDENYILKNVKLIYYKIYNYLSYGVKKDNFVNVFQLIDKNIVKKLNRFETSYPHVASMINSVSSNSTGVKTEWIKRHKGHAKNNIIALLIEAFITLTQFTIFLPVVAVCVLTLSIISFAVLFLVFFIFNIEHLTFQTLFYITLSFNFVFYCFFGLILSIKIYYLSKDIKKDNIVLVKETYNL